jgi:hypothetical protein
MMSGSKWASGEGAPSLYHSTAGPGSTTTLGIAGLQAERGTVVLRASHDGDFSAARYAFGHFNSGNRIYINTSVTTGRPTGVLGGGMSTQWPESVVPGRWYTFALGWDAGVADFSVEGKHNAPLAYSGLSSLATTATLSFNSAPNGWGGRIAYTRLYSRALSAAEIAQLYAEPYSPDYFEPIGPPTSYSIPAVPAPLFGRTIGAL